MEYDKIPDFLNRKLNPVEPATLEERQAFAAQTPGSPAIVERRFCVVDPAVEAELAQLKKIATGERIKKMLIRKGESPNGIPTDYLSWDGKRRRFVDIRDVMDEKLRLSYIKHGLPERTRAERDKVNSKFAHEKFRKGWSK